jgi:hypothetical protein
VIGTSLLLGELRAQRLHVIAALDGLDSAQLRTWFCMSSARRQRTPGNSTSSVK